MRLQLSQNFCANDTKIFTEIRRGMTDCFVIIYKREEVVIFFGDVVDDGKRKKMYKKVKNNTHTITKNNL
jgi:hypothetical protein